MFSLKKSWLLTVSLLLSSSAAFADKHSNSLDTVSPTVKQLLQEMEGYAQDVGITVEQWHYAVSHFEMLEAGDVQVSFPTLDENPLYQEGLAELKEQGSSIKLVKVVKEGKANYASYLGLPVEKLEPFLSYYTDLKESEHKQ